ncbi:hypothetical protein [Bacillus pumilus]|uniref:DUF3021 domain-containing protein n=1 Tax=Bacillus pumilus TaxID=1408 RepID=A0AAD0HKP6_BACPU|nr:hypothetical protein [Bacillus pumilus]AVM22819.1 hypothetical protein C5695_02760 [Bacillus pumilus]TYS41485.1 hypothetical protein FZC68_14135 [Bacillus pumilus]
MIKEMKNQFMQTSFVSIVWLTLILSMTNRSITIPFGYVWHIIAIGTLAGIVFGVIYPLLWNYFTFPAPVNILISTAVNLAFQLGAVALYSTALLELIMPYFIGIAFLTLAGHIIAFLFYKKHQNQKMAQALNRLKPQS